MKIKEFARSNYEENFGSLPSTNYLNATNNPNNNFNPTSTGNLGIAFNTQTLQTEKEIRKIIEREIEPFIFSAKNDLRLNIENFSKEIADYKFFEAELRSVKEMVQENKRLVLVHQEESERKINDNNYKFKAISNQFDNVKENMFEATKKIKTFEKIYEDMQEKFFSLEDLKQKFSQWENMHEKIFKQVEEQFAERFSSKLKALEVNLENSKSQVVENGININNLAYEIKSFSKQSTEIKTMELENSKSLKEVKEKLAFFNSDTEGKIEELKNTMNSYMENSKINFKNINEEIELYKNVGFNSNSHKNSSQTEKIESLNSNLLEMKLKFDKLTGKINNIENKVDEFYNDIKSYKTDIDEIKKIVKENEIDFKECEEKNQRKFAIKNEIDREISELKKLILNKILVSKDENYKALNEECRLLKIEFENKLDFLEKEFVNLKEKFSNKKDSENLNSNTKKNNLINNLNISSSSNDNPASPNAENLLDIQKLKSQVEEIKKIINSIKEENYSIKNDLEAQKSNNRDSFEKQSNNNELFEKTLDEIINQFTEIKAEVEELKIFREKNNENLAKIQESFKKVKTVYEKMQSIEETISIHTEGMEEILKDHEVFKTKFDERFDEIEKKLNKLVK